jgi:hypothetical protein
VLTETVDFEALRSGHCPVELFLSATNVRTGKIKIFRNDEIGPEAVLASACLPLLFQAVEIDGEHYWDGGYISPARQWLQTRLPDAAPRSTGPGRGSFLACGGPPPLCGQGSSEDALPLIPLRDSTPSFCVLQGPPLFAPRRSGIRVIPHIRRLAVAAQTAYDRRDDEEAEWRRTRSGTTGSPSSIANTGHATPIG